MGPITIQFYTYPKGGGAIASLPASEQSIGERLGRASISG
jgi:hypothetical protein